MKLIIGLGNPGIEYLKTRHNIGFLVVDSLAEGAAFKKTDKGKAEMATVKIGKEKVVLLKPQTFMNKSGEAAAACLQFYKIPIANMIVVHDDADLPFGDVRVQTGRSAAGHKGVQSIIDALGKDKNFTRVRVGIGRPANKRIPLDEWVLKDWTKTEEREIGNMIDLCLRAIRERI